MCPCPHGPLWPGAIILPSYCVLLLCLPLISSLTLARLWLKSAESSDWLMPFKTVISSTSVFISIFLYPLFCCCLFFIYLFSLLSLHHIPSDLFWSSTSFAFCLSFMFFFPYFYFFFLSPSLVSSVLLLYNPPFWTLYCNLAYSLHLLPFLH